MKTIVPYAILLTLIFSPVTSGSDFEKGLTAFFAGDFATAVRELTPLAEQGEPGGQFFLGVMHDEGKGVPQDDKTAFKWYQLAAEQGDPLAQSRLGVMYGMGQGILKNTVYAHMWFNIAASSGDEIASNNRDIAAKQMTPQQLAEAQNLARECVAKDYKGC